MGWEAVGKVSRDIHMTRYGGETDTILRHRLSHKQGRCVKKGPRSSKLQPASMINGFRKPQIMTLLS